MHKQLTTRAAFWLTVKQWRSSNIYERKATVVLSRKLQKRRLAVWMSKHRNGLVLIAREWLGDCGWGTCLSRAGLITIGHEESFLTRS